MSHSPTPRLTAIAAMAANRVIGCQGRLPWHLPEDFQWFKSVTMGHVLVMGRKTFESIGRPLPGRDTVVISRSGFRHPGVTVIQDLRELAGWPEPRRFFICGGAQIYALALPFCAELFLTQVLRPAEGEVLFPPFEDRFTPAEVVRETGDFRILRYVNQSPERLTAAPPGAAAAMRSY
ncbi:MAG: dihydrofolate reductase [Verrucomicrobiae bacterium]|nr:dihydrofolate reductase [Verrucomicrobiae bacterium]